MQSELKTPPFPPVSHLTASHIPEGTSGGFWHNDQATKPHPCTVDTGVGVSALVRPCTGDDGGGDTERNHPVPPEPTPKKDHRDSWDPWHSPRAVTWCKISHLSLSGNGTEAPSPVSGSVFTIWEREVLHTVGSLQPARELMSKFCSWKKHIGVDNVLADKPDVKTRQDNVTESLSCSKREAKR